MADWDFFSFPVYFGFAAGSFVTLILLFFIHPYFLFLGALFGVVFCLTHVVTQTIRRRTLDRRREREEEEERERRALAARAATAQQQAAGPGAAPRRRRRRRL